MGANGDDDTILHNWVGVDATEYISRPGFIAATERVAPKHAARFGAQRENLAGGIDRDNNTIADDGGSVGVIASRFLDAAMCPARATGQCIDGDGLVIGGEHDHYPIADGWSAVHRRANTGRPFEFAAIDRNGADATVTRRGIDGAAIVGETAAQHIVGMVVRPVVIGPVNMADVRFVMRRDDACRIHRDDDAVGDNRAGCERPGEAMSIADLDRFVVLDAGDADMAGGHGVVAVAPIGEVALVGQGQAFIRDGGIGREFRLAEDDVDPIAGNRLGCIRRTAEPVGERIAAAKQQHGAKQQARG